MHRPYDPSTANFWVLYRDDSKITDDDGPTKELRERVAVKTADLMINREADVHAQVVRANSKPIKNATDEDIAKAESNLETEGVQHFSVRSTDERTAKMVKDGSMLLDGDRTGGFSGPAKGASNVGDIRDFIDEDEDADMQEEADGEGDGHADRPAAAPATDGKRKAGGSVSGGSEKPEKSAK